MENVAIYGLISGCIGFALAFLIVMVAIYLCKKEAVKKKKELESKMGVSLDALQSALQGSPADK